MEQVAKYFSAEKGESILFFSVGLIAIILAIYFLIKLKQPFYNGLSYSLIAIAFIQIAIGITIYIRTPNDIIRVNQIIQTEKEKFNLKKFRE